ncbi:MAG: carbohydrate-binding family 9-like protein [Maribacter sp.]
MLKKAVGMRYYGVILFFIHLIGFGQTTMVDNKELHVVEIAFSGEASLSKVSELLEANAELHSIDFINWEVFPYRPEVKFRIAHHANQIWLKLYVQEENVLAQRTETNSATHRDSCVEFFLDPIGDGNYYNFEFNCIGVTHLAYGPDRNERKFVDPTIIEETVRIESSLGSKAFEERKGGHEWEMTVVIPAEVLTHNQGITLKDLRAKANFYKCADDTSKPHYLSWNPVGTDSPDFHQPSFFGSLIFD